MNRRHKIILSLTVTLLFSLIPYLNSIQGELVHDDRFSILENPDITNRLDLVNIFSNDFWGTPLQSPKSHKSYRPFTVLTFKLNYYLHEFSPEGYHILNVLIHSLNSVLCFLLSYSYIFSENIQLSLLSACLFASHPIHTEAVAGVVGRAELLACFAFLIAFYIYLHLCESIAKNSRVSYCSQLFTLISVGTIAGVSTLCKENGLTVLGVCGLIDLAIYSRENVQTAFKLVTKLQISQSIIQCRHFLVRGFFLFLQLVLILSLRLFMQRGEMPGFIDEDNPASFSSPLTKFLSHNYIYFVNLYLLFMPSRLSYDWQMGSIPLIHHFSDTRNIYSLLLWILLLSLLLKLSYYWIKSCDASTQNPIWYSIILLIVPFLPSSNVFLRVGFVIAERVLYIPSLGLCIGIPFGLSLIFSKSKIPRIYSYSIFLLVILFSLKTFQRNKVWLNRESLFLSGIRDMPHNAKMHYNYANFLKDNSRDSEAILHYREAISKWPSHASSHNNLGTLLEGEEAIQHFRSAIELKPTHSRAMFNLGNRLSSRESYPEAIEAYRSSLRLDSSYSDCWQSLSAALISSRAPMTEVVFSLEHAESTATQSLSHLLNIAKLYLDIGNRSKAEIYYSKCIKEIAVSMREGTESCYLGLAGVYRSLGELGKAEQLYEQTIQLFPDCTIAYTTFGSFLSNNENNERALELYRIAFQKQPSQSDNMVSNFVQILLKGEQVSEARELVGARFDLNSSSPHLLKLLVQVEITGKQDRLVLDLLEQHSALVQDNGELLYFRAIALRNLGSYAESLDVYLGILLSDPDNYKVLHDVAVIYHIQKKFREALGFYERALKLSPNDPLVIQNIQKLKRSLREDR